MMEGLVKLVAVHSRLAGGRLPATGNGWKLVTLHLVRPFTYAELEELLKFAHYVVWTLISANALDAQERVVICLGDVEGDNLVVLNPGRDLVGDDLYGTIVFAVRRDTELGLAHPVVRQVMDMAEQCECPVKMGDECEPVQFDVFAPKAEAAAVA